MRAFICILALAALAAGCAGVKTDREIAMERADTYVAANPGLSARSADAIASNAIRNGMTVEQVMAAWGRPAVVQQFRDGELQYMFFGCDYPHLCNACNEADPEPQEVFNSRAIIQNGVVIDWQS